MGEDTGDGTDRGGEHEAIAGGQEEKPGVIEDANSQRVQEEPVRAGGTGGAGEDDHDQIESSLVSELGGAQNPEMGRSEVEVEVEEGSSHLFTDAMKLQLRAQILVLGDLLKGIAPNPDWLEDACLESAIGAESVLLEDVPRGSQGVQCGNTCIDGSPTESNLRRISSASRDRQARMSPFTGAADLPIIRDAIKDELHSPGEPSSSGKEAGFRDDSLAHETEITPAGQLLITYDNARSNSFGPEDSPATENLILDNDKHLDLAQASAQDALTTATSALAQSHLVWARLHSQDHSEEGIARDARLASVAATVAAASSVAKAAVEAARAIAEVSMDAFIQASGYQLGDVRTPRFGSSRSRPLQVDGWEQTPFSNSRENVTPSQQRAEMLESVVQAAGKAAEAASQAGAVLAKANPLIQTAGLNEFWSRRSENAVVELEGNEANEIDAAEEMYGLDGEDQVGALHEMDVVNELDILHEEEALEKMDNVHEKDSTYHDNMDEVNDVREQVIANNDEVVEDDVAPAIENHVAAANENGVVRTNEVAEPFEQEKRISPRSRKMKRGRGRSRGFSSRTKRAKITDRVSSPPLPTQSPENVMHEEVDVSRSLEDARHETAGGRKHGAKHMENATSSITGEDPPATAPAQVSDDVTHATVEVSECQENARDRNSGGKKRGAKHVGNSPVSSTGEDAPATAPVHSPEDDTLKQDDVSASRKNARGRKRGTKHTENRPLSATVEDMPAASPAQNPENEALRQDDVSPSQKKAPGKKRGAKYNKNRPVSTTVEDVPAGEPAESPGNEKLKQDDALKSQKVVRGKKRGAKHIESRPMSTIGEDIPATAPAQSPENELHKKDEVPKSRKNLQDGTASGRTRSAKHLQNTTVSTSGKDTAARDVRDPETVVNTLEVPDNALQEGSAVEVMIDEVGLRGGWFSGTVLRVIANEAFVELLDLLTDDGKANVREWFPLVEGFDSYRPRRHARPVHPFTIFSEAGSRKRRRVALGSQTWHIGDQVDAFIQDAWWEGLVAEINDLDPTKATVYFPEENDTQVVKTFNLRPSFQWKDNKWIPWKSLALVEDERPQKRHRTGGPNKMVTPDVVNVLDKSNKEQGEERGEGLRIQEAIPETRKSPVEEQQENNAPLLRAKWKKSKKNLNPHRRVLSTNKAHQTDVLSPGTSKHLNLTTDATAPTASVRGITPLTKGKLRRRRKRYT